MSGQATGWVLRHGPEDRAMRAVLIPIADAANRDGDGAIPGFEGIVEGSRYSRATVYRCLRQLEEEGWIETVTPARGPGYAAVYRVLMGRPRSDANGSHGETAESNGETAQSHTGLIQVSPDETHSGPRTSYREIPTTEQRVSGSSPDAERLCLLLADLVEANGSKRPKVTQRWLDECDRLIRLDGKTPEQVERAIRWCQSDTFWRANVLSMPKLRERYDQLRLAAERQRQPQDGAVAGFVEYQRRRAARAQ